MVVAKSNLTQRESFDATVGTKDIYPNDFRSVVNNNNMGEHGEKPPPWYQQFVVEHLASFPQDVKSGYTTPTESLEKLKIISSDASGGLWAQKMNMNISPEKLLMTNGETMEMIEEYPMEQIDLCITILDDNIFDNLLVFATKPSQNKVGAVHLFQCKTGEPQAIAYAINGLKHEKIPNGNAVITSQGGVIANGRTNSSSSNDSSHPPETRTQKNLQQKHRVAKVVQAFQSGIEEKAMLSSQSSGDEIGMNGQISQLQDAKITRDVEILNKCIEEIENFVVMLKRINEARKQLQQKKGKNKKKKVENILILQSQPPPDHRIQDIYEKFKHAFNLLGKLQPHISDPSAPELIHYLFIPLGIIVKVTGIEKARSALDPLLTSTCVDLLKHCLDSKEYHFWTSLGPNWTLTKSSDQFKNHYIPPYMPVFVDGWVPPEVIVNEKHEAAAKSTAAIVARMQGRKSSAEAANTNPTVIQAAMKFHEGAVEKRTDEYGMRRSTSSNGILQVNTADIHHAPRNNSFSAPDRQLIGIVVYDYLAHNNKELTIRAGEKVIILENSRRWWLVRNDHGEEGFVPSTVLEIPAPDDVVDAAPVPERYLQNSSKQQNGVRGSPIDSNQNYVNGSSIPTPPLQQSVKQFSPPVTKCTPPPPVTRYTPPQPQHISRMTPSPPTHFSQVNVPSPQPVNKITPVVISVKIPQNPNMYEKRTSINVSPAVSQGNEQTIVKIPTTSMVVKKKESIPSLNSSPVQDDGRVGQAVIRTVTADISPQRKTPKNDPPRSPPVLTIPPPPMPPPPPAPPIPSFQPKPKFGGGNKEISTKQRIEPKVDLQDELRHRLSLVPQVSVQDKSAVANIDQVDVFIPLYKSSTADDVSRWLRKLGFSELTIETLKGKTAQDLFKMDKETMLELLSEAEGLQLYDELQVQNGAIQHKNTLTEFQKALVHRVQKRENEINRAQTKSPAVAGAVATGAVATGAVAAGATTAGAVTAAGSQDVSKFEEQSSAIKRQKEELQRLKAEQAAREPGSATFTSFQSENR